MKVETRGRGVLLPELRLALDTAEPGYESVCSHAHGDHIPYAARHAQASPETADILGVRAPHLRVGAVPWGEPCEVGDAVVTLHPSGHILGAALVHVEAPDGETLLYTADTKERPSATAPAADYPRADVLVVESTFGLPVFRFPEADACARQMAGFARDALDAGEVPVFLGYALGKAQEILALLTAHDVPTVAHGAVWNMCRAYERHGVRFPLTRPYEAGRVQGAALVVPPDFRAHPMVTRLRARVAYVSGWALLARSRVQLDADALVPLSDHADYEGLRHIVARVRPSRILTNHGYADAFAHALRLEGHDAQPLATGHVDEDAGAPEARLPLEVED